MKSLTAVLILAALLCLQIAHGPFGFFGLDWSLCGLLVLCVRMRSPAYQMSGVGLGLVRDVFSVAPLGAQALGLGITATLVHALGNLVFLENFLIQGAVFFTGYVLYQAVFFTLGKIFGFLDGGFWGTFLWTLPKAALAAVFCCIMTLFLPRPWRDRSDY